MIGRTVVVCTVLAFALAGCAEKDQTTSSAVKKSDEPGWKGGNPDFNASGWVASDRGAWEAQLRARAHAQNDYAPAK